MLSEQAEIFWSSFHPGLCIWVSIQD